MLFWISLGSNTPENSCDCETYFWVGWFFSTTIIILLLLLLWCFLCWALFYLLLLALLFRFFCLMLLSIFFAELLLENGADLSLVDDDKNTPLHHACINVNMAEVFIKSLLLLMICIWACCRDLDYANCILCRELRPSSTPHLQCVVSWVWQ